MTISSAGTASIILYGVGALGSLVMRVLRSNYPTIKIVGAVDSDPTKAGQAKREVGTNPFIVGPEAEEGNRLLEILRENPDMEAYILNTGSIGPLPRAAPRYH